MSEHAGRERKSVKLVIVGAGNRGTNYANYALEHADLCQVGAAGSCTHPPLEEFILIFTLPSSIEHFCFFIFECGVNSY